MIITINILLDLTFTASNIFLSALVCAVSFWFLTIEAFFKTFIAKCEFASLPVVFFTCKMHNIIVLVSFTTHLKFPFSHLKNFSISSFAQYFLQFKILWTQLYSSRIDNIFIQLNCF